MQTIVHKELGNIEEVEKAQNQAFLRKITEKFFVLWPWLICSVIICLGLSVFYLKTSFPKYKIHASVLVQDDKKSTSFGEATLLEDFGMLGKSNVDNEAEIFKSRSLLQEVVERLHLNILYHIPGNVKSREVYASRPINFTLLPFAPDSSFTPLQYTIKLDKTNVTNFSLSDKDNNAYKGKLGDTIKLPVGLAIISLGPGFAKWPVEDPIQVSVLSVDGVTQQYMGLLSVKIPNKQVSVINLTLESTIPAKGEFILNTLINAYMQANLADKNRIADSTIHFIDERLRLVFRELSTIEKDIEGFKTNNRVADLSVQSRILLENTSEYAKQQTTQEVQLSVVRELESFLKDTANDSRIVPSALIMQDANFIALTQRFNETQLQRDKMLMSLKPQHPSVQTVDEQLRNLRNELLGSIASIRKGIEIGVEELKKRTNGFEDQISKVPAKERAFLDFSRQQAIKEELFLFLLKKREETAISKSSNIANARVIDPAKSDASPFKPQKALIIFVGLLAGLILPFVISIAKDVTSVRVSSLEDISNITSVPVLAEIGHNIENEVIAVSMESRKPIAEQFRSLRTNLKYLLNKEKDKTILITSSMSGEGKSFLSINLCTTLALAGKRTILLELDLRKPKVSENLQLRKHGFTNYIISNDTDWRQWIQPSGVQEHFDVLSSGPLPPNPTELLMLPKTATLFKELKEEYDYIVIDSPPAGMVTDPEIMSAYADATFYVVRDGFTFKQQISLIERLRQKNAMPRINIIVNDRQIKKAGYGYGYGYYYGTNDHKAPKKRKKQSV